MFSRLGDHGGSPAFAPPLVAGTTTSTPIGQRVDDPSLSFVALELDGSPFPFMARLLLGRDLKVQMIWAQSPICQPGRVSLRVFKKRRVSGLICPITTTNPFRLVELYFQGLHSAVRSWSECSWEPEPHSDRRRVTDGSFRSSSCRLEEEPLGAWFRLGRHP